MRKIKIKESKNPKTRHGEECNLKGKMLTWNSTQSRISFLIMPLPAGAKASLVVRGEI
jgi:hypothetical protein